MMLQNYSLVKATFKVQDQWIIINIKIHLLGFRFYITTNLQETTTCHFGVVSKNNIHNHLKRLLEYASLFQPHICVRSDFPHILKHKK